MGQVSLVATADFPYAGRKFSKGDRFDAPENDARLLKITHKAIDAPVLARTFIQTRDLSVELDAPESDAEPVRAKRQYRRRDLTAEP